jgi:hypothetical protein
MSDPPAMPLVPRFDISPKPVWGQRRVGGPKIHNQWSPFRKSPFVDDTPPIREKSCSRELRLHSRIAPDSGEIPQAHLTDTAIGGEAKVDLMSMPKLDSVHI